MHSWEQTFKALKCRTPLPETVTEHMQDLTCDHGLKHAPCVGSDAEGNSRTRMSAAYTTSLWSMLMIIAALLAGVMVTFTPDSYDQNIQDAENYCMNTSYATAEAPLQEWLHAHWAYDDQEECYLVKKKLEIYWDRVKDLPPSPPSTHVDV